MITLKKILLGGGVHETEQEQLLNEISKLKQIIEEQKVTIQEQKEEIEKVKKIVRKGRTKELEDYNLVNLNKSLHDEEITEFLKHPEVFEYDDEMTAFDKKKGKNFYRDYQERFINDWSVSTQEMVILYYGVGSGKTLIAVNCAQQFLDLNPNSHVYFITPASLVLNTIKEMYKAGIDPTYKRNNNYVYYFLSYQQL